MEIRWLPGRRGLPGLRTSARSETAKARPAGLRPGGDERAVLAVTCDRAGIRLDGLVDRAFAWAEGATAGRVTLRAEWTDEQEGEGAGAKVASA